MRAKNRVAMVVSALVAVTGLAACSSPAVVTPSPASTVTGSASPGASAAVHNEADTGFAQMMIVHHQGAIEMADLAASKAESPEVTALAVRISAAQGPEIDAMSGWLTAWGENPSPAESDMPGMDHSGMEMDGMSQEEVMTQLRGLSGAAFDRQFLTSMIAHHEGAIEMAGTQLEEGQNSDAVELAEKIIQDQRAEIEEMKGLVASS